MFQPDVLAAAQYMEKWRYQRSHEPEKMLMYAVLEDAITSYQRFSLVSNRRDRAAFKDAEDWLMHEKSDWPFSFERICEALDLNPDYIRTGLARWRSNPPARRTKTRLFYVVRIGRRVRRRSENRFNAGNGAMASMTS
jgi:hypothetical protein